MAGFIEIKDESFKIGKGVYYAIGGSPALLPPSYYGQTLKEIKAHVPGIRLFEKDLTPRFPNAPGYPFGY